MFLSSYSVCLLLHARNGHGFHQNINDNKLFFRAKHSESKNL